MSSEWVYKDWAVSVMSDEDFASSSCFINSGLPRDSIIALRHRISDAFDLPLEKIHPEMKFSAIPMRSLDYALLDILVVDLRDREVDFGSFPLDQSTVAEFVVWLHSAFHGTEPTFVDGKPFQF